MEMNVTSQAGSQTSNQTTNQTANQAGAQTARSSDTAALSSELNLLSAIINNVNRVTAKQDSVYVIAATIGLLATYLTRVAAIQEANEQQIAPGVTTFANNLKLIASALGLLSAAIAYWALLIEVSLRAQGISAPQTPAATGSTSATGSVLVQ